MSLNTLSTGSNPSQLLGTPLNESDSSELLGSDSSKDDSDLPSTMDDIFLLIYQLLAALQTNAPTSTSGNGSADAPTSAPSGDASTPSSASDDQANQPIEKRTSWPSLGYDFDPKDIKGKDAPPALRAQRSPGTVARSHHRSCRSFRP